MDMPVVLKAETASNRMERNCSCIKSSVMVNAMVTINTPAIALMVTAKARITVS
ncbi:hypothetical protein D3C71_2100290 [compost metagenome]